MRPTHFLVYSLLFIRFISRVFIAHIIGKQGTTRKRLEAETKTQIKVPKQNVEGDVVVIGTSRQSVTASRQRIEMIVISARSKQPFTHFLSIPFATNEIKSNFLNFKENVLDMRQKLYNLEESLFQKPEKLHLTVCTLSLMDNDDRSLAAQLLQDCKEDIIDPILDQYGPIKLKLEGLEYMNDDPKSVDVLYAKVESEPLQMMVDRIESYFVANGLIQKKYDHVKMHVTLINTRFRDNIAMEDDKTRITFDASKILENFGNFYFGTEDFKEIHLSQRYSTACDGFYEATGMIKI